MRFKQKISSKEFWLGVGVFSVLFLIGPNLFVLWWSYGFELSSFLQNSPFSDNLLFSFGFQFLKAFVIGFLVFLISFKPSRKGDGEPISQK